MDNFLNDLNAQLKVNNEIVVESVTLDRVLAYYKFLENKKMFGSICFYPSEFGTYSCWANVDRKFWPINSYKGRATFEGHGKNIAEALDDILLSFVNCGLV